MGRSTSSGATILSFPRSTTWIASSAWLDGRDYVTPDDVRSVLHAILRHRLIITYDALADQVTPDAIIDEIIKQVAVG